MRCHLRLALARRCYAFAGHLEERPTCVEGGAQVEDALGSLQTLVAGVQKRLQRVCRQHQVPLHPRDCYLGDDGAGQRAQHSLLLPPLCTA